MSVSSNNLDHAVTALRNMLIFSEPADMVLSRYFRENPKLGSRDRAFIAETVYSVLRRKRYLEYLAGTPAPRPLVLAYLARIQGINLREMQPLLRGREMDWIKEVKARPTENLPLGIQADFPDWVMDKLLKFLDEEALLKLARALQQPAPLDLRVNTLLAKREEILEAFKQEGITAAATPYSPIGIRLADKIVLNRHPLFTSGKIEVQDEGSQLLGFLLAPKRNEMVVDFCAGAGGKTLMLGAFMNSQGRLYAFDVAEKRLNNLKPRLKRSGLSNIHPQLISGENDAKVKRLAGKIDRVLVDAPCSGLGTLRRNPDLKWRQTSEAVAELVEKQKSILASAARLIKPGGRLVYGTCSILPDENEEIVTAFLASHPEFQLVSAREILAQQYISLDTGDYLRLNPAIHGTDGFFAAVMEKSKV